MNNYRIEIGNEITINHNEIMSISGINSNSAIGEDLSIDESTPVVIYAQYDGQTFAPRGYEAIQTTDDKIFCTNKTYVDMLSLSRGTAVRIYVNNVLWRKTYLRKIVKVATAYVNGHKKYQYEIDTMSAVGLMDSVKHFGGMYQGTYGAILREIFSKCGFVENTDYVIDADVSSTEAGSTASSIYCYLPIASCRDNLKMCLNACGASILKQADGKMHILYNVPTTEKRIQNAVTYNDGSYDYEDKATRAVVIEHHYITGGSSTTLYSNSEVAVVNKVVTFNQPMYNLQWNGSAFTGEHSCNHAVLNGTGILTGNEYIHTQTEIVKDNLNDGEEKEVSITDNTLVTALNSLNVLERLAAYYGQAQRINASYVITDESPMDKVKITDKFGDVVEGYIKDMDINASSTLKATSEIVTNWQPNHLGNSFTHSVLIKASDVVGGVYDVSTKCPDAVGKAGMLVLFSGMGGGQAGYNGQSSPYAPNYLNGAEGGNGGNGGVAGTRGKFVTGVIFSIASSYNCSMGEGGAGGVSNGAMGSAGGDSTFGDFTTVGASQMTAPYTDLVSGDVYGQIGTDGYAGGKGGHSLGWTLNFPHDKTEQDEWIQVTGGDNGGYGENKTYDGVTYQGGSPINYMLAVYSGAFYNYQRLIAPCGGGGAAYGSNGGNCIRGDKSSTGEIGAKQFAGIGGDAVAPANARVGYTGDGGHGGGGAGGCGWTSQSYSRDYTIPANYLTDAVVRGGNGSAGGKGSDGFAILYYGEE